MVFMQLDTYSMVQIMPIKHFLPFSSTSAVIVVQIDGSTACWLVDGPVSVTVLIYSCEGAL